MNICVITDNDYMYDNFKCLASEVCNDHTFIYFFSYNNLLFHNRYMNNDILPINLSQVDSAFFDNYGLIFSLHCKQIFPQWLVETKRCVNIHPGFNPYNRGYYPHVFSMINGMPTGATIHEMDKELDHGMIICQQMVEITPYDTGKTLYDRIISTELELLRKWLRRIINGEYETVATHTDGNINTKSHFQKVCEIDLDSVGTMRDHLKILRALSFQGYQNAYYVENGKKVYIELNILSNDD